MIIYQGSGKLILQKNVRKIIVYGVDGYPQAVNSRQIKLLFNDDSYHPDYLLTQMGIPLIFEPPRYIAEFQILYYQGDLQYRIANSYTIGIEEA